MLHVSEPRQRSPSLPDVGLVWIRSRLAQSDIPEASLEYLSDPEILLFHQASSELNRPSGKEMNLSGRRYKRICPESNPDYSSSPVQDLHRLCKLRLVCLVERVEAESPIYKSGYSEEADR